jgi:hypothetical protein
MTGSIDDHHVATHVQSVHPSLRMAEWTRKSVAYGIAIAINLSLISGFIFSRAPASPRPDASGRAMINVSIIDALHATALDDEVSAAAITASAETAPEPALTNDDAEILPARSAPQDRGQAQTVLDGATEGRDQTVRDDVAASVAFAPLGGTGPEANAQTRSTLQSLTCAHRIGRDTRNLGCGDAATEFTWAPHLNAQATAEVEQQVSAHLSSLGGLFGYRHPGEMPTGAYRAGNTVLAAPSRSLAASDSMRDRLPPMAPDPAFGD